jgi:molybdopterin-binding protein
MGYIDQDTTNVKLRRCRPHRKSQEAMMKLSARNQLKGKILEVKKGATTSHVRVEIGAGVVVLASITNEAVDELGLKPGDQAWAVIKASDVMIGK